MSAPFTKAKEQIPINRSPEQVAAAMAENSHSADFQPVGPHAAAIAANSHSETFEPVAETTEFRLVKGRKEKSTPGSLMQAAAFGGALALSAGAPVMIGQEAYDAWRDSRRMAVTVDQDLADQMALEKGENVTYTVQPNDGARGIALSITPPGGDVDAVEQRVTDIANADGDGLQAYEVLSEIPVGQSTPPTTEAQ